MSLTDTEKGRAQAAAIAAVLDIVADEMMNIHREGEIKGIAKGTRELFLALHDNLAHRAKDYHEAAEPVLRSGSVKVVTSSDPLPLTDKEQQNG